MPNHVTNWVEITGSKPKIAKLKKDCIKKPKKESGIDGAVDFDFNGIKAMPKELADTVSPVQVTATKKEADAINKEYAKKADSGFPGLNQPIRAISAQQKAFRLSEYGAENWYDWALNNWGTKWGAYDCEILYQDHCTLVLKFDTAWSPPDAIFEELESRGYTVNCKWQDEDPSNEGEWGDPYMVFDIYHPTIEVDYIGPAVKSIKEK